MLEQYLNIFLASAKRFRSGRFTSPQLYHPYKTTAENYWLLRFNSRAFLLECNSPLPFIIRRCTTYIYCCSSR